MRIPIRTQAILSALLLALAAPAAAQQEKQETPKAKIQRKQQAPQTAPATQTQTAPAPGKEKGKPQTAPGKAGLRAIQGHVDGVFPEQKTLMIRTATKEYRVFLSPQSVVVKDSRTVGLQDLRRGDRIDYCHFNAKNVVQKMSVTSAEKASSTPLPPLLEP